MSDQNLQPSAVRLIVLLQFLLELRRHIQGDVPLPVEAKVQRLENETQATECTVHPEVPVSEGANMIAQPEVGSMELGAAHGLAGIDDVKVLSLAHGWI